MPASDPERAVRCTVDVDAPIADVWTAWTTRDGIRSFFAPEANIDLRVGGRYEMLFLLDAPKGMQGGEGCTILAFQPPALLSFTWNAPPHMTEARAQFTHATIRLAELPGNRTRVSFVQDGWGAGGEWDSAFRYFSDAWCAVVFPRLVKRFVDGPIDRSKL